jgi:hypothetical protein
MAKSLNNKLQNLIKRGVVKVSGDDLGNFPVAQIGYMGKPNQVELLFPYGTHANVGTGIESAGVLFNVLGDESNRTMLVNAPLLRPKGLKPWEFITGNFKIGTHIFFDADGKITQTSASDMILKAGGNISLTSNEKYEFKSAMTGDELMLILSDFANVMDNALVTPSVPFNPATKSAIQAIKARIEAMKL